MDAFVPLTADYDIVIAHRPLDSAGWPRERVHVTSLLTEPIDLAMSVNHPLAQHSTVRLEDLAGQSWLAAHEGFALEPLLIQALVASAGESITINHRVNEFNVAAAIIAQTGIIGLLPRYTGLPPQFRDRVVLRPIENLTLRPACRRALTPRCGRQSQRTGHACPHPARRWYISQRASASLMILVSPPSLEGTSRFITSS